MASPSPMSNINQTLTEINQLLTETIQNEQIKANGGVATAIDAKQQVKSANQKTDTVLTDQGLEIEQFERLVSIYNMAKKLVKGQRTQNAGVQEWEQILENKADELEAKKAVIDKEKFDSSKALEREKNNSKNSKPKIEKAKKIWDDIKKVRSLSKGKIKGISERLKELESLKSKYPGAKTLKQLKEKLEEEKRNKAQEKSTLDTKIKGYKGIGKKIWKLNRLKSTKKNRAYLPWQRDDLEGDIAKLEHELEPYNKDRKKREKLEEEIECIGDQISDIDEAYNGIHGIAEDIINGSQGCSQETIDYVNGYMSTLESNMECSELQSLLVGDMANSKLAEQARDERKSYNDSINKIAALESMQQPSTSPQQQPSTPAQKSGNRQVVTRTGEAETSEKAKQTKTKKKRGGKKTKENRAENSNEQDVVWDLELMTEKQKIDAATKYYRKHGSLWTRLRAGSKAKTEKGRKEWEEYYISQHKSGKTTDYAKVQKEEENAWRKKLLHTVAAKAPGTNGYELTNDERDDLYK